MAVIIMLFPINKKYRIIYADPPWKFCAGRNRNVCNKYNVMTANQIKELPVDDISDTDCCLFLWITMPHLPLGLEVIKDWGFKYKTVAFTWIKMNKKANTPFMGMGHWTRSNAEICLLATRGKPKRINAGIRSLIQSPIRKHSQKPDEARDRIVQLCGDITRIELFARRKYDGWNVWGNEVESD